LSSLAKLFDGIINEVSEATRQAHPKADADTDLVVRFSDRHEEVRGTL